jgi:hypothetical protein
MMWLRHTRRAAAHGRSVAERTAGQSVAAIEPRRGVAAFEARRGVAAREARRGVAAMEARRGVAAMEFAMVAPLMVVMVWGVWDVARAMLAWEETVRAAEGIAQAAEKLSVKPGTGSSYVTTLTSTDMQNAMTTIFAQMPWLGTGNGDGEFTGPFFVLLSGVEFVPPCAATATGTCAAQAPYTMWSSALSVNATQLKTNPPQAPYLYDRPCGALQPVAEFPNNASQFFVMIDPNLEPGSTTINLIPQVVADVVYTYTPTFPLLRHYSYTFYASATFPAPLGGDNQPISFDQTDSPSNNVEVCPGFPPT